VDSNSNLVLLGGAFVCAFTETGADSSVLRLHVNVRSGPPENRIDVIPVEVCDPSFELTETSFGIGEQIWIRGSLHRRFWEGINGRSSRLTVSAAAVARRREDVEAGLG